MIPVSLKSLCQLAVTTRYLWPEQFRELVTAAEEKPADRSRFGVIADWLEGLDSPEPEFAAAWRWLMNRPRIALTLESRQWWLGENNGPIRGFFGPEHSGLAGLVAELVDKLEAARGKVKAALADLE